MLFALVLCMGSESASELYTTISFSRFSFRLTGFQLFLNKQKESRTDDEKQDDEDIVPAVMRMWKELNSDEKKEWNAKAKQGKSPEPDIKNMNNKNTTTNKNNNGDATSDVILKKKETTKTITSRNKLSTFAFNKNTWYYKWKLYIPRKNDLEYLKNYGEVILYIWAL